MIFVVLGGKEFEKGGQPDIRKQAGAASSESESLGKHRSVDRGSAGSEGQ